MEKFTNPELLEFACDTALLSTSPEGGLPDDKDVSGGQGGEGGNL